MNVEILKGQFFEENTYLLSKNEAVLIIDPGADFKTIKEALKDRKLRAILITHDHFDHVTSLDELVSYYNLEVYSYHNLSEGINKISNFEFEVIYTPGHSLDSVSYYFKDEKALFTGDFIFDGDIGRTDLKGGSKTMMEESLKKIVPYLKDNRIYPGHGSNFTKKEKLDK